MSKRDGLIDAEELAIGLCISLMVLIGFYFTYRLNILTNCSTACFENKYTGYLYTNEGCYCFISEVSLDKPTKPR